MLNDFSQLAVASGYFDFSVSGMHCQVRLLDKMDARHKGNSVCEFWIFVEKAGEALVQKFARGGIMRAWLS